MIIIGLILFPFITKSQKEANIWYFGNNAGLDFNSGNPMALTDGQLNTLEGCASVADSAGQLLFYTDGSIVYNSKHKLMDNGDGLWGCSTSTQSAIIVKKPGSQKLYYIFTVDGGAGMYYPSYCTNSGGYGGLSYSVVDISLNGGLGKVIQKNSPLVNPTIEKVTGVLHKNKEDIWIVTHLYNSDEFHAFLVSDNGINTQGVVSKAGAVISGSTANTIGYLKASPTGEHIAAANRGIWNVYLMDFDNATGKLSNLKVLDNYSREPYGVEFSPKGDFLYVSEEGYNLYQYEVKTGNVKNTRVNVGINDNIMGAVQLAPDGKIYVTQYGHGYLGVINQPDSKGTASNFIKDGAYLGGRKGQFGLPTFFQSYFLFAPEFEFENLCYGDSTAFELLLDDADSVLWDFDDPPSSTANYSNEHNPKHLFSSADTFEVKLIVYQKGNADTTSKNVIIGPLPEVNLGSDTVLCPGEEIVLQATENGAGHLWNDGSTEDSLTADTTGTYWLTSSLGECQASDTVAVKYHNFPSLKLGEDTVLCSGDSIVLQPLVTGTKMMWQDTSHASDSFVVKDEGLYWVSTKLKGCTVTDSVYIKKDSLPTVSLIKDTTICKSEPIVLDASRDGEYYYWHDGSISPYYLVQEEGTYKVDVVNQCGTSTDSVLVEVTDCDCEIFVPNSFTPNGDGLNDQFMPKCSEDLDKFEFYVYNAWGELIFESDNIRTGWDGKRNGNNAPESVYVWMLKYSYKRNQGFQKGSVTLVR